MYIRTNTYHNINLIVKKEEPKSYEDRCVSNILMNMTMNMHRIQTYAAVIRAFFSTNDSYDTQNAHYTQ
jgi:hypothetical protein